VGGIVVLCCKPLQGQYSCGSTEQRRELITFVWLLMAHFGIGDQFQINEGHARAKLIVGK
jgi:hypothetical protein